MMLGLPLMLIGLLLRLTGWLMTPNTPRYKLDEDPEWMADVEREIHRLNLKEAEEYARRTSRHVDPNRN